MTQVATYYTAFNNKLVEFVSDLSNTFPEMHDLKVLKSGIQLAKTVDIKMPRQVFNEHVADVYEQQILDKNEDFFLKEDYSHITQAHGLDIDIVSKLKEIWGTLDQENRNIIWKYLEVLVLLNRKCKSFNN